LIVAPPPTSELGATAKARLAGFAGFLRANGYGVGAADSAEVLATALRVGVFAPLPLRWSLKALLCSRADEWRRFDALFDAYFLPPNKTAFTRSSGAAEARDETGAASGDGREGPRIMSEDASSGEEDGIARLGASRDEVLASTDFSELERADDAREIERLMRHFARRMKPLILRREKRFYRGRTLDLQGTIRRSVGSGGAPVRLLWRSRRQMRPRLVLLLDVSRSMSPYSFFYLRLARALSAELADVHCFIFHTRLTGVSEPLRDPDPWRSQERLHLLAEGWGGGTRIGECLQTFNAKEAARLVHSRTGIIIVSDGYDTGEPAVLAHALDALSRRARRVIWLNPLLAQPGFAPESAGMKAALPLLAPGADLASIERALPRIIDTLR